jgi:toxin ParE1/3/4
MAEVIWSPRARRNFDAICSYLDLFSEQSTAAFAERVYKAVQTLEDFPRLGRIVPEFQLSRLRELIVQSYRVVYSVMGDNVEILTVIHGARRLRLADLNGDS